MLEFQKIHVHNFLSIEDTEFEFKPGIHIILGRNPESEYSSSNGSGKSSLIESIPFALFKNTTRELNDIPRKGSTDGTYVSLDLRVNNSNVNITRYINCSKTKNDISFTVDGEPLHTKGIRRLEKDVQSTIGISYDLFVSSIMILQGFPIDFCSLTPTLRKSIIESMLGLVVWEDINAKFSSSKERHQISLTTNKEKYIAEKENMVALNSKIEGLKSMSDQYLTDLKAQVKELKNKLRVIIQKEGILDEKLKDLTTKSLDTLNKEVMSLSSESTTLNNEISRISQALLQSNCPTCGQSFPKERFDDFKRKKEKYIERLNSINVQLQEARDLVAKVTSVINKKTELGYAKNPINMQIKQLLEAYQNASNKPDIEELTKELEKVTEEVNNQYKIVSEEEKSVNGASTILSTLLPSSPFRTSLITRYLSVLNSILREVCSQMFEDIYLELLVPDNEKGVDIKVTNSRGNKINYKTLSGGERRRLSIAAVLAIQRFLIEVSAIDTNLVAYDEIFDGLDHTGLERCISTISSTFDTNKCVYLISHNDDIKSEFPSQIIVNKRNGISTVDYSSYISSM